MRAAIATSFGLEHVRKPHSDCGSGFLTATCSTYFRYVESFAPSSRLKNPPHRYQKLVSRHALRCSFIIEYAIEMCRPAYLHYLYLVSLIKTQSYEKNIFDILFSCFPCIANLCICPRA